jgi:hypothetical protein
LICDERTRLESLILIIQHERDCHFVRWWLIRSGTCGNRRKSKAGLGRAFFGSFRHLLSRLSYNGRIHSTVPSWGKSFCLGVEVSFVLFLFTRLLSTTYLLMLPFLQTFYFLRHSAFLYTTTFCQLHIASCHLYSESSLTSSKCFCGQERLRMEYVFYPNRPALHVVMVSVATRA